MVLTELPLGLPGRAWRSPMPFGAYDRPGQALHDFATVGVSTVIVLAGEDELRERTGLDLLALYRDSGLEVLHVPLADLGAPAPADRDRFAAALATALARLRAGRHLAVHCHAGKGRTGLFAACLARQALGLDGDAAIAWVRRLVPGAVETPAQEAVVRGQPPP